MKIVFMGTPDFSVGTLEELIKEKHVIAGVVTQADKPKGRGKTLQPTPIKEVALRHGLLVYQPAKVRDPAFVEILKKLNPDVMVVVAFGQIIPQAILDIPKFGCINVHASLLPKYRGAAPIQWAVINGEKESGVTIMRMDAGLDTGDMIAKTVVTLDEKETGKSLFEKLSRAGAGLCAAVLREIEQGTAQYEKQPKESPTAYAGMIDKKMGHINWKERAVVIEQLIRGLSPWPSAYTYLDGKTLKIWSAKVEQKEAAGIPGQIVAAGKEGLKVKTGEGILCVNELQLEGKKRMDAEVFLRGYRIEKGILLG